MGVWSTFFRTVRPLAIVGRKIAAYEETRNILTVVKEAVCFNQGRLSESFFIASLKHKKLKELWTSESNRLDPNYKATLAEFKDELEHFVYSEFVEAYKLNRTYLIKYFDGRSRHLPGVCIKFAQGSIIYDPGLRNACSVNITPSHPIKENTGFATVNESGTFYLCNDIPRSAKIQQYINTRLRPECVAAYKEPLLYSIRKSFSSNFIDEAWCSCWVKQTNSSSESMPSPGSCYKSTLIVPMTLIGNSLSDEFKRLFKIKEFHDKAIFGFLCFDHRETNYFEDGDEKIGFIVADLLCLYLVNMQIFKEKSKTFKEVDHFLKG